MSTDSLLLYSTNPWIKKFIREEYYRDIHFVWCSPSFDGRPESTGGAASPPSSSPASIMKRLQEDVRGADEHSDMILRLKLGLLQRAQDDEDAGRITREEREEIAMTLKNASFKDWRPLLFVIPTAAVKGRIVSVPRSSRAGHGVELQIPDLAGHEFHALDFDP